MIQVHRFMPEVLADILRRAPLTEAKVVFAWRTAVGPAVHRVTTIELRDSVLYVRVRDASWRREIERSTTVIRARLDALLGAGVVRSLDVRGG